MRAQRIAAGNRQRRPSPAVARPGSSVRLVRTAQPDQQDCRHTRAGIDAHDRRQRRPRRRVFRFFDESASGRFSAPHHRAGTSAARKRRRSQEIEHTPSAPCRHGPPAGQRVRGRTARRCAQAVLDSAPRTPPQSAMMRDNQIKRPQTPIGRSHAMPYSPPVPSRYLRPTPRAALTYTASLAPGISGRLKADRRRELVARILSNRAECP